MADLLNVQNITVRYEGRTVLDNISFKAGTDSFTGIIGPNGAGKSTLLKVILGLISPDQGRITFISDGQKKAKPIGYVPQSRPAEIGSNISVRDFVALNLPAKVTPWLTKPERKKVRDVLQLTQTEHLAQQSIGSLSGGEKQKIYLAQALIRGPGLLLLDEPTANLDPGAQEQMAALVSAICRNRRVGVLFISHDINLVAKYADHILILSKADYVFGKAEDVLQPDRLSRLYGYDVSVNLSGEPYAAKPNT